MTVVAILHPCYIRTTSLDPQKILWYYNFRKEHNAQKI